MATDLTSNCMMLIRTPQMLKKSGINKGNAMNYLAFVVRIVQVCAVKPRDVIGWKKEEPALIVVSWRISFHISNWYQFIFIYFIFENLILHIFLIIIIIIRCSGMFHVPGFTDGPLQLVAMTLYILAEIVRSSFTGRDDPSELCSWTSLPFFDLKPFSSVISPLESEYG